MLKSTIRNEPVSPYPIYFDKRPIKIVFLVTAQALTPEVFSNIFNFNFQKYNGRLNPIVLTSGSKLSDEGWDFLRDFDPDVIKILFKPEKGLLRKIEDWLSPYLVELHDPKSYIGGTDDYISIGKATDDLISRLTPYYRKGDTTLGLFNLKNVRSEKIKQFIHFNFGTYEDWTIERGIEKVSSQATYNLDTSESVSDALEAIAGTHKNFVFPIQLSVVPNHAKEADHDNQNEQFTVVVGDSPYDLAYYWNRSISIPHWLRPEICHIWLPTKIAEDKKLEKGLQLFFRQRTSRVGNSNSGKYIRFISFSLKEKRLKKIADNLGEKVWSGKRIESFAPKQVFPNYGPNKDYFHIKQGMDPYQAYSTEENVVVEEPHLPDGVHGGYWMLDVYLQYRPERYQYTNIRHWWRLPNRNHLTRSFFPQKIARIQKNGIPSILMETKSTFKPDESNLAIQIPNDGDIIIGFIFGHNRPVYTRDPRSAVVDVKTYFHTQRSDKGKYLQGLIGLFGGLGPAYYQFSESYWRNIFEILSHTSPTADIERKKTIANKIKKELPSIPKNNKERDEELKWLAGYILQRSKEHGKLGKEVTFSAFINEKIKEIEDSYKKQDKSTRINKKRKEELTEDLRRDIHELIESHILLMGIKPHCSICGYSNWYHIDEMRQDSECRGCGNKFDLLPEEPWFYRLNSLIQDSVSQHGLVPVLLTLGQMHDEARSSFIYNTSLDLFKRIKKNWKHLGDLDIVCVQDGKFVMGEIKQSSSLFKKKHFEEALRLAKKIKPNVLMFSSLDGNKTKTIKDGLKLLQKNLEPMKIDVVWYKLHQISI